MEYLLQLLIEKIENSENQWKPGANGWKSLSNKAGNLYDDRKHLKSDVVKAAKELEKTGLVKIEWYYDQEPCHPDGVRVWGREVCTESD